MQKVLAGRCRNIAAFGRTLRQAKQYARLLWGGQKKRVTRKSRAIYMNKADAKLLSGNPAESLYSHQVQEGLSPLGFL